MWKRVTPEGLQSRLGDKPLKFQVVCYQNGTAVLKDQPNPRPDPNSNPNPDPKPQPFGGSRSARSSHAAPPGVLVAFCRKQKRPAAERPALTNKTRILHKVLCRTLLHTSRVDLDDLYDLSGLSEE